MSRKRKPSVRGKFVGEDGIVATTEFDEDDDTPRGKVLGTAELLDVKLISLQYSILPEAGNAAAERNFNGKVESVDYNAESGIAFVYNVWRMHEALNNKEPFVLEAAYVAIYGGLRGAENGAVKGFFEALVPFSVYPYFRSLVSQMAWAGGVALPVMPILRSANAEAVLAAIKAPSQPAKTLLKGARPRTKRVLKG